MRARSTALVIASSAVLVATARQARSRRVDACEERIFRIVNTAPDGIRIPVWLVMQSGSLGAVGVAALAARRTASPVSVRVLVAGSAAWSLAKLIKPFVGRGRPEDHLDDVTRRGALQTGLGFPSGHAAVATTLALVAAPTGVWGRTVGLAVAGATGLARMYVGAHLPLDVVGGIAIGSIIAAIVPSTAEV